MKSKSTAQRELERRMEKKALKQTVKKKAKVGGRKVK
jgi:hypothetical protein